MVGAETLAGDPGFFLRNAWLIALLPFLSGVLTLTLGKRTPGKGPVYGIAALGSALVLSLGVLWHFVQGGGPAGAELRWFEIGPLQMTLGQYVDGLTAVMLVVVTSISLCVHIYSLGYMHGDVRFTWFYVVLSVFTGAMLNVVIADNLFQLLLGWEVMGVCSYLLIGHWWEEKPNTNASLLSRRTMSMAVPNSFERSVVNSRPPKPAPRTTIRVLDMRRHYSGETLENWST